VRVERAGGLNAQDLAAMSRQSGSEVALYRNTSNGERYIAIGNKTGVNIPENSRLIAHTQPGTGAAAVRASVADEAALARLNQRSSVIIDEGGTAATRFRPTERGAELARTETGPVKVRSPEVGNAGDAVKRVFLSPDDFAKLPQMGTIDPNFRDAILISICIPQLRLWPAFLRAKFAVHRLFFCGDPFARLSLILRPRNCPPRIAPSPINCPPTLKTLNTLPRKNYAPGMCRRDWLKHKTNKDLF
jgi:hypothetical protein